MKSHFGTNVPMKFPKSRIFGELACSDANRDLFIENYLRHENEILEFFGSKSDKLLFVNWDKEIKWKNICDFLGVPLPKSLATKKAIQIPRKNQNSYFKRVWKFLGKRGFHGKWLKDRFPYFFHKVRKLTIALKYKL